MKKCRLFFPQHPDWAYLPGTLWLILQNLMTLVLH